MNGLLIALSVVGGVVVLLLLAIFLGSARVRLSIDGEVRVSVSVFGVRKQLFPRPKPKEKLRDVSRCRPDGVLRKEEKRRRKAAAKAEKKRLKEERKRAKKASAKPSAPAPAPNLKENIDMIFALLKRAYTLTHGKLGIEFRKMHLRVATGDAAQTAILYGVILQTSTYLLQWVESHFNHVRREDGAMTIDPDFLADRPSAEVDLRLSVRLFRAIGIGIGMFRTYLSERRRARRRAAKRVSGAKT